MEDLGIQVLPVRYLGQFLLVLRHCFPNALSHVFQLANVDLANQCQARHYHGVVHWLWTQSATYSRLDLRQWSWSNSTYYSLVGDSSNLQ